MTTVVDETQFRAVTSALKTMARTPEYRAAFAEGPLLRQALAPAARRYVFADDLDAWCRDVPTLDRLGYRIGVEVVGEEAGSAAAVDGVVAQYLQLIDRIPTSFASPVQLGFDLSNVGALISPELAYENTSRILTAAAAKNLDIVLSMENSGFVPGILATFRALAEAHDNVGLTLQAHLHRTAEDLDSLIGVGAKLRLVKGVYNEDPAVALPRGPQLDARYIELLEKLVANHPRVTCASQDPRIHGLAKERGLLARVEEVEMLYGVRPEALRALRDEGVPCRIATVYGSMWWLHVLHRIAEYPPNVLVALADMANPSRVSFAEGY